MKTEAAERIHTPICIMHNFLPDNCVTKRPKYIDLLLINPVEIIPDDTDANSIIRLFAQYDVMEYKGVGDVLNFNTLANGIAYTCAANRAVFERIRGVGNMCKAMWELMKPEIDDYVAEKDKKLAQNDKKLAQSAKKIAEQEREIERLNKIIAELSVG